MGSDRLVIEICLKFEEQNSGDREFAEQESGDRDFAEQKLSDLQGGNNLWQGV